jgi:hypothetical protein
MFNVFTSTATIVNPQITQQIGNVLSDVLQLVLSLLVAGIGWAVKLWISNMNSAWKQALAKRLVSYAEQKIETNDAKIGYVAQQMHEKFPRMSEEEIHHLIEEAVVGLKAQLANPAGDPPKA